MSQVNLNSNSSINELYNIDFSAAGQTAKMQTAQHAVPTAKTQGANTNSSLPQLESPNISSKAYTAALGGASSMWAKALNLITEMSAQQRQATRDQKALQTEMQIDNIMEQAKTIQDKAITQLVLGVATGAVSVGMGFGGISLQAAGKSQQFMTSFNNISSGFSGAMQGSTQAAGSFFDTETTKLHAQEEQIKAMTDQLESLDQSLKELLQKALSTQDAIQENINQTRTKILG